MTVTNKKGLEHQRVQRQHSFGDNSLQRQTTKAGFSYQILTSKSNKVHWDHCEITLVLV